MADMNMKIKISINDHSDEIMKIIEERAQVALEAVGLQAERNAKLELENNPRRIDTGRLRNSITHTTDENTAYIGTNVEYAPYVHEGTTRPNGTMMAPNRFLKNALQLHIDDYKKLFKRYLSG